MYKLKIIIINFLFFILCLFLTDFLIYCNVSYSNNLKKSYISYYEEDFDLDTYQGIKQNFVNGKRHYSKSYYKDYSDYIILFGCSYTFGFDIDEKEKLSYKLFKNTKYSVINMGMNNTGIQHMLYILGTDAFYNKYIPKSAKPKFVIYTYIPHHIYRSRRYINNDMQSPGFNLLYKYKNGKLLINSLPFGFLSRTFIARYILFLIDRNKNLFSPQIKYENFKLINEMFLECKRILENKYPGIQFIILRYRTENDGEKEYEVPFMWEVLKSEGFIILDSVDMVGRKFKYNTEDTANDGYHPSGIAWDILVPKIIEKLNL